MVDVVSRQLEKQIGRRELPYDDVVERLDEIERSLPDHAGAPRDDPRMHVLNMRLLACEVYRRSAEESAPLLREYLRYPVEPRARLPLVVAHCRIWPEIRNEFLDGAITELESLGDPNLTSVLAAARTMRNEGG